MMIMYKTLLWGENMISKKDLLKKMNISYGQLYRWKREELIPEEWFVKTSAPTGQETYFDENLIIPRINKILGLKDEYSIEEQREMFKGTASKESISVTSAIRLADIDLNLLKNLFDMKRDFITYDELTIIDALSVIKDEGYADGYEEILRIDLNKFLQIDIDNSWLSLFRVDDELIVLCHSKGLVFGKEAELVKTIYLGSLKQSLIEKLS